MVIMLQAIQYGGDDRDQEHMLCVPEFLSGEACHELILLPMENLQKTMGTLLKPAGKPHDIHKTIPTYVNCHDTHV